jgi:hypothetical protein
MEGDEGRVEERGGEDDWNILVHFINLSLSSPSIPLRPKYTLRLLLINNAWYKIAVTKKTLVKETKAKT